MLPDEIQLLKLLVALKKWFSDEQLTKNAANREEQKEGKGEGRFHTHAHTHTHTQVICRPVIICKVVSRQSPVSKLELASVHMDTLCTHVHAYNYKIQVVCACMDACVCVHICVHVCLDVYMCVCMCVYIQAYLCTCM